MNLESGYVKKKKKEGESEKDITFYNWPTYHQLTIYPMCFSLVLLISCTVTTGFRGDFGACGNDGRQIEDVNELISMAACFDWPAFYWKEKKKRPMISSIELQGI